MKKNKIYVVTMYRFALKENHSYLIYAGFSKSKAIDKGLEEEKYRGGKYSPEVVEYTPDVSESRKIIKQLTDPGCRA